MKILRSNHFEKAFTSYIIRSLSKNSQIHLSSEKFDFKYFEESQSRDLSISVNCMRIIKLARKIVRKYSLLSLKTCSILIFRLSLPQCGNFGIFLPLIFFVKSIMAIMANIEIQKLPFWFDRFEGSVFWLWFSAFLRLRVSRMFINDSFWFFKITQFDFT